MDLDESDIRLLARIRKRRRYARLVRVALGVNAILMAALAMIAYKIIPKIPTAGAAEIPAFEVLRWQAVAAGIPVVMLLTLASAASFMFLGWIQERDQADALILKLLGQRSGFPNR